MTREDKELLFRYLSMALPYELRVELKYSDEHGSHIRDNCCKRGVEILNPLILDLFLKQEIHIKPYLRPMSSMTQSEKKHLNDLRNIKFDTYYGYHAACINYLNSIHVDYNGLIGKGLAIEVTKENNPYK